MCYTYNYYTPLPDLVCRVKEVHHQYRLLSRQHDRVRRKIAAAGVKANAVVDEETHSDLVATKVCYTQRNSWMIFHLIHFSASFGDSKLKQQLRKIHIQCAHDPLMPASPTQVRLPFF